ncbi:uncharacterized protein LOC121406243 [Lytechinus variegatus]|uniref:uncharacterized protein LOC121406243 n=1 Tax=Lytechinus variegatus TaxID=7654 RepID=UPI001BB1837F|nr:uncharacterized protein LOC121406243 [Lytechinus variegatus]
MHTENFKFQRKGNEEQHKVNVKIHRKLKEAEQCLNESNDTSGAVAGAKDKIIEGLGLRKAVSDEVEASGAVTSKLRKLSDSMASHLVHSGSDGTVNKYYSAFKRWETFITTEGGRAIPAESIQLALCLTSLIDGGKSPSVIQV